jgi:quercetin dioxygenase-like cupin family protein
MGEPGPVLVQPEEGTVLHAFGETMTVMLGGGQTAGQLAIISAQTPPGVGPPPHIHTREDEIFLVEEGSVSYFADGEWSAVRPGGAVFLPRNQVHTYRNDGESPSRHWIVTVPSGFESFFGEAAAEFESGGEPDIGRLVEVCAAHGIELLLPG